MAIYEGTRKVAITVKVTTQQAGKKGEAEVRRILNNLRVRVEENEFTEGESTVEVEGIHVVPSSTVTFLLSA